MIFKGFIFDLDGTLVDSKLNFENIRTDLELPTDAPILEEIARWPSEKKKWAQAILDKHEVAGAEDSVIYPGVAEFLKELKKQNRPHAIFTRNSRIATERTLQKHKMDFSLVITRDDAPAKPSPEGLLQIINSFQIPKQETLYIGDYLYDLQAGRAAQIPTAIYLSTLPLDFDITGAHFTFEDFFQLPGLLSKPL